MWARAKGNQLDMVQQKKTLTASRPERNEEGETQLAKSRAYSRGHCKERLEWTLTKD